MKEKSRSFSQRIMLGLIFVLIFVYTFYHVVGMFGAELSTYAAGVTTETTYLHYNGYLFRDETVLTSPYSGAVDYAVADGTKVKGGQALATVYADGNEETRETLRRLDEQIAILEQSVTSSSGTLEMGALKQSVSDQYDSLIKMLASGVTGGLSRQVDKLLVGLNQMSSLSMGEDAAGQQTLRALREERAELLEQSGASVTHAATASGYFYSQTDGYESIFTMDALNALTASSFFDLITHTPLPPEEDAMPYGKIGANSEWGYVLPIPLSEQSYFAVGHTYSALFAQNNQTTLPLTLERIIEAPEQECALLVFSCDRLPAYFTFDRAQSVRLEVDSIRGIYVSKELVERVDGFRGVYILRGNVVRFRYVEIVYEGEDYYLVKPDMEDDGDRTFLQVNDFIIVNGKNLFDGRVFD